MKMVPNLNVLYSIMKNWMTSTNSHKSTLPDLIPTKTLTDQTTSITSSSTTVANPETDAPPSYVTEGYLKRAVDEFQTTQRNYMKLKRKGNKFMKQLLQRLLEMRSLRLIN